MHHQQDDSIERGNIDIHPHRLPSPIPENGLIVKFFSHGLIFIHVELSWGTEQYSSSHSPSGTKKGGGIIKYINHIKSYIPFSSYPVSIIPKTFMSQLERGVPCAPLSSPALKSSVLLKEPNSYDPFRRKINLCWVFLFRSVGGFCWQ